MQPLLSIITVTYNCAEVVGRTLESILQNKPQGLEYLVIDGASTDNTLEVISQWRDKIDTLVTEPDEGIYHAMNKGLKAASGEYVLFINAGDELFEAETAALLLSVIEQDEADIYYGDTMLVDADGNEIGPRSIHSTRALPAALDWQSLKRGMVVSHQSFIVRRSIAPMYNLEYVSSSDIDWVINCLKRSKNTKNLNRIISRYLTGGISKQHHPISLRERYNILRHHYGFLPNIFNHLIILLRSIWFRIRGKALN